MPTPARTPTPESMRLLVSAFNDLRGAHRPAPGLYGAAAIVEVAVRGIDGAMWVSITLADTDRFWTTAATHDRARQADDEQYAVGSGPCVDAIVDDMAYQLKDVAHDRRWPHFAQRAARHLGVASMISCPMVLMPLPDCDLLASLNVYSGRRDAFNDLAMEFAQLLAAYGDLVAAATEDQDRAHHLQRYFDSSRGIGIAIGVLMATHKITSQEALDRLKIASQHTNRNLSDLAAEVADTGTLTFSAVTDNSFPAARPAGRTRFEERGQEGCCE